MASYLHNVLLPFIALTLLTLLPYNQGASRPIKIGAIFHAEDEDYIQAFQQAIDDVRQENPAPAFELHSVIKMVKGSTDSFKTNQAVCELLEEGVAAIFGPPSAHTRGIVSSIAARFNIPHMEYVWREHEDLIMDEEENLRDPNPMTTNVYPDSEMISKAIADVVIWNEWKNFVAIYETNEGLSRIQRALTMNRKKDNPITIRHLGPGPDYRSVLKEVGTMPIDNIILDVKPQNIMSVLLQAKEVNLVRDYVNFIITYMDSSQLPILEIRNASAQGNITGFSLRQNDVPGINWAESAVLYDAVFLVHKALEILNARTKDNENPIPIVPVPLSCDGDAKYEAGLNVTNLIRELPDEGKITGSITFDETGRRRNFALRLLDFRWLHSVQMGYWDQEGVHSTRTEQELESYLFKTIEQNHFRIATKVGEPYIIEVTNGSATGVLIDKKYYEGYCIDVIESIANILKFKYTFILVPDNQYGSYVPKTKSWNGLMKLLLDHEADLAICDLTITSARESVVDFTMPFMNLGISILFSKPDPKEPAIFSFLSPLSADVWIYMATAYLIVSLMLYLQARMAPGEWNNPHPCNPDPEELENNFDLKNSMWLTVGSLMQQGSDILPRAPSIRMVAGMWWFFTLIMVSSYTANLAAFLTIDKMDNPIKNVEELAKQTKIKYGAVSGGSTSAFFRDSNYSTYQRMWATMAETRPSVFTETNNDGVERVVKEKGNYAFLMESTTIEYKMLRNCELQQIGSLIDNKGYGIALPRNSPYRTPISGAILTLQEKGILSKLKQKWWEERRVGKPCKKDESESEAASIELGLANVGGVFLVLMLGCAASLIIAIFEFLWNIRKVAVEEKITPWEALIAELKFAVNISLETKPVKMSKSSSGSTSTEVGIGRAASTARSIVGSFLRLDILDKFDKDNNTNNRGNDRKIN